MKKNIVKGIVAGCVAAVCAVSLAACGGSSNTSNNTSSSAVAATVNGTNIYEDTITNYIQGYRTSYGYSDDDTWAEWMSTYGYTPETVRSTIIDSYVSEELVKQACDEKGITIDSSTIDGYVESVKSYYESDEEWQSALSSAGLTEESYRESIENSLKSEELESQVAPETDPDEADVLEMCQMYMTYYNGAKKSSHILFAADDEATAQSVLDQLNAGTITFEEAAVQYSTDTASASDGGNVGWDALNSFVTEYTDALDELSEGEISGLVTSDYGIHIIKCTEVLDTPDEITSTDQVPSEFLEVITDYVKSNNQSTAYSEWMEEYEAQADITINEMPEGLPYDVDMSAYENTSNESTDNETTVEVVNESTDNTATDNTAANNTSN